jgi:hypothetical protein
MPLQQPLLAGRNTRDNRYFHITDFKMVGASNGERNFWIRLCKQS